jgi:NADPH2:quinone reductase
MTVEYLLHGRSRSEGHERAHPCGGRRHRPDRLPWANYLGANVIGTVGSKDKAELAKANGCHHTILYRDEDFRAR